jgi:hypothetical protein
VSGNGIRPLDLGADFGEARSSSNEFLRLRAGLAQPAASAGFVFLVSAFLSERLNGGAIQSHLGVVSAKISWRSSVVVGHDGLCLGGGGRIAENTFRMLFIDY